MGSIDTGWVSYENQSGLPDEVVLPSIREVSSYLQQWTRETRAQKNSSGLFDRTKFAVADNPFDQMRAAMKAVQDDDVVSAAADVTEGLILQGTQWGSSNELAADLMNQVAGSVDLDGYLRTAYREEFAVSQTVTASWWGYQEFTPKVRKPSEKANKDGSKRSYPSRKTYRLWVPEKIITLDPTCVVPVGQAIFGRERLAWHASADMLDAWDGQDLKYDAIMSALFKGRYVPTREEEVQLTKWGVNPKRLIEFNPDVVWRHTRTKSAYQPFADLRMKSVFRLLDMKQQLLESDRVMLVGAANYILLVKKGSDNYPAAQPEVDNLKEGFSVIAKLPVIVSDHRLTIEIISPALDMTLIADKYNVLDSRILSRLFGAPSINSGARGDQTAGITTRMMQRHLEGQRHMLRRMVEKQIRDAIWNHPRNREVLSQFKADDKPSLFFTPRNVQLDNDAQITSAIMAARQQRDLSRESFLEFFGFDQAVEAQRMEREEELYDEIFQTAVPFAAGGGDGKGTAPSQVTGAQGGRPAGGGSPSRSAQSSVKPKTATGTTKRSDG
jgi:hypothetical protein